MKKLLKRELEICAQTLQACAAAEAGGADRIELCAALGEGGVSPSMGMLDEALRAVRMPVHVLVRPRTGDFCYSGAEFRAICGDAERALGAGAAGIVVGMLTERREIDQVRLREFTRVCAGGLLTFHRAIDQVGDGLEALEQLIELGFERVLSSGGAQTVDFGLVQLQRMVAHAEGRIRIAAGGGVTLTNAARIAATAGLDLHASLRTRSAENTVPEVDPLWKVEGEMLSVEMVRTLSAIVHEAGVERG